MTINTRNKIIVTGLSVAVLLLVGFLICVVLIFQSMTIAANGPFGGTGFTSILVSLLSELVFSITAVTILYFSFKKTTSAEIFFFIIFLVTMTFDSLKAGFALFAVANVSPFYGVLLTRMVYFSRFLGTLAILAAGLFAHGAEYQRMEIYLGAAFLLSVSLSTAMPVDFTVTDLSLLYAVGNARELGIVSVLFLTFGVFNFVLYAIQNSSRDYALIGIGLALTVIGREMLFFMHGPIAPIAAFVMLIGGTTLFSERTHAVHLWS
jgi:hypothetical protein